MALIAGALHQHRDAQLLQLLLYLRGVVDHGGLHRQVAPLGIDPLVVRGAVLPGIQDLARLHGRPGLLHIPALGLRTGQTDSIQAVQLPEQVHGRGGRQIDPVQGLLEDRDPLVQPGGHVRLRRDHQIGPGLPDLHQRIPALIVVHGELLGVLQLQAVVILQVLPAETPAAGGTVSRRAAGRQQLGRQNRREERRPQPPEGAQPSASFREFESNLRV